MPYYLISIAFLLIATASSLNSMQQAPKQMAQVKSCIDDKCGFFSACVAHRDDIESGMDRICGLFELRNPDFNMKKTLKDCTIRCQTDTLNDSPKADKIQYCASLAYCLKKWKGGRGSKKCPYINYVELKKLVKHCNKADK